MFVSFSLKKYIITNMKLYLKTEAERNGYIYEKDKLVTSFLMKWTKLM
ncbi:hypothetical protein M2451_001197 [Dysgonomonas sp. PFB1-18]|nr:hypothetical protein [Dysgonomonas sp. PF1-14]MDH6338383.1 hypothetical protein [Dysgonomonas sp. PF1-16]MDH6379880.1 hypothetical protein [Dysgonomonas sp. PFB1-18]MDH6397030.1 hypothetical protein [Dysgonomonas sp. PF1-23]